MGCTTSKSRDQSLRKNKSFVLRGATNKKLIVQTLNPKELRALAAVKAKAVQEALVAAAAAAPDSEKAIVGDGYKRHSGPVLEPLFEHTDLIDVNYLIVLAEEGGIVPTWSDVPDCARINSANIWRLRCWNWPFSLPMLILSYPWLDIDHPDPLGETLRRILPVLIAVRNEARTYGAHATVGVLWDFCSLPQGKRTPEHQARFTKALYAINEWYAHPFTPVLLVTTPLPTGSDYINKRPYAARGWCYFEKRISSLVKYSTCLWDLSQHEEGKPINFDGCRLNLNAGRAPFVSPEVVARELAEGVESGELGFTSGGDMDVVSSLYQRGFVKAFETFRQIGGRNVYFTDLRWSSEEAPILAEAIRYAHEHCQPTTQPPVLDFDDNKFTSADKQMLRKAAGDASRVRVDV